MEARSSGPGGDAEQVGDLDEGQPEVVVQDEDRPLVDRDAPEGALQLVAVGDSRTLVRGRRPGRRQDPDARRPMTRALRLVVAGVDQDPMDPGLETVRIAKVRETAPGQDEGVLQSVLRQAGVAQDPYATA